VASVLALVPALVLAGDHAISSWVVGRHVVEEPRGRSVLRIVVAVRPSWVITTSPFLRAT
jgi:hypothetical protein